MTRVHRWLVSGVLLLVALTGMLVLAPQGVDAATATITADIELRAGSGADAIVVQTLPAGSVVSINGPPENGSYPVSFNGTSGWISSSVLDIAKDEVTTGAPAESTIDPTVTPVATEVITEPTVEPTVVPAPPETVAPPAATAIPTAVPPTEPLVTDTTVPSPTADDPAVDADAPVETETPETETPIPPPPALASSEVTATPEPTPTATPVPTGPATTTTDLNLRAQPTESSAVLFLVSAGSTVWRTGSAENGYVSVDYMGIVGWIAAEYLAEPGEIIDEEAPRPSRIEDDPRTARPGSGTAFTTTRLTLREGPSASTPAITEMPARSRVTLTGVSENGFHRVVYKEQIGWASLTYLSLPASPTPAPSGEGGQGGGTAPHSYTEEQIVKIIYAAADRYNQPQQDMLRVAQCESALDPYAVNPSGSYGLFQFVPSTWETTPYADEDIFDPRANANAAAWMWSVGRRAEWVCQ